MEKEKPAMIERKTERKEGITRRAFTTMAAAGLTAAAAPYTIAKSKVKMFKNLGCGHLGVSANQIQAIDYAAKFGFGGVNPDLGALAKMDSGQLKDITAKMKDKNLQWGSSGLPVNFRGNEDQFNKGILAFPKQADALQKAGVTRISTWILSGSNELTYTQNFEVHRKGLKACAEILKDRGIRLGLEFLGPKTLRNRFRFPFACTQIGMLELCDAIGTGNVGLLFDAWHWHTSSGTVEELLQLTNDQIINVHVNDAPKGIALDRLIDNKRALPTVTGVIDLKGFINALVKIGYDGPVTQGNRMKL